MSSNELKNKYNLKKTLDKTKSLSLIIGSVLGSGLMILPGLVFRDIGVYSFLSWLAMGIFMIPFLYIFTKLTIKFPSAGGVVNVIHNLLGSKMSICISYLTLFGMLIIVPAVAIIGANYIGYLFSFSDQTIILIAGIMLVIATVINIFDISLVLKIQGLGVTALLFLLFIVIIFSTQIAMPNFTFLLSQVNLWSWDTYNYIGIGMIMVFWAFLGWENLSFTTEEFINIKKDLPKAVITSFILMMILYLGLSMSVIGILTPDNPNIIQAPLAEVISISFGTDYGKVVAVIGILIMVINLNAWVWGPSRLLYDCGRKNIMPSLMGELSKFQTPIYALSALLMLYLFLLSYLYYAGLDLLDLLIQLANVSFMVLYLLTIVCFFKVAKVKWELVVGVLAFVFTLTILLLFEYLIFVPLLIIMIGFAFDYIIKNNSKRGRVYGKEN